MWKDLIALNKNEPIILPWLGGKTLHQGQRSWKLEGALPPEFGWYRFLLNGRKAIWNDPAGQRPNPDPDQIKIGLVSGFLIGDRIVPDGAPCPLDLSNPSTGVTTIHKHSETVHCLEPGLDRFSRIQAGRMYEGGPLLFKSVLFPLGPEEEVQTALLDNKESVSHVKGVPPALEAAFHFERYGRAEASKRRTDLERLRREADEKTRQEEERRQLYGRLGDGSSRRVLAQTDFVSAATAALAVCGAEYLDHRPSNRRNEFIVKYRYEGRRYECVCDNNLHIVEAGFCLNGYNSRGVAEKGDTYFTLESIIPVLREAMSRNVLHVFRHVDDYYPSGRNNDYDDEDTDY